MLKHLGLLTFILILAGCASSKVEPVTLTETEAEALKTRWDMEGRTPEWKISINGHRFHGSFPGRYEGRVMEWDVIEKDNKTYLTSKNQLAKIELTETECSVAEMNFTHSAIVKINKNTFKGCAKHKS